MNMHTDNGGSPEVFEEYARPAWILSVEGGAGSYFGPYYDPAFDGINEGNIPDNRFSPAYFFEGLNLLFPQPEISERTYVGIG